MTKNTKNLETFDVFIGKLRIKKIENRFNKSKTKAFIIAAGLDRGLKKYTENLPKCIYRIKL